MTVRKSRRLHLDWRPLVVLVVLAMTTAACGDDSDPAADASSATDPAPSAAPTTTGAPATSTSRTGAGTAESSATSRTVDTPLGAVDVPVDPQRIVVLWGATLSSLAQLDVQPVAAFGRSGDPAVLLPYLPDGYPVAELELVSDVREVNLEAVAAAKPDLILGADVPHLADVYEQLSAIAPTALLEWDGTRSWRTMLTDVAAALGVPDRAEEAVRDYEARVGEVRERVGLDDAPLEVSLVRIQSAEELRIETPESFSGQILADVGFTRPEDQIVPDADADYISLSLERIPDVDGDAIIATYSFDDGESSAAWRAIGGLDLWQALPAVQAGKVIEVDFTYWASSNYYAAHRILDDLEAAFG